MAEAYAQPPWRQQLHAILLALLCAVLFLRDALLPGRALVPYAPELYDVQCAEALASGALDPAAPQHGNVSMGDKYAQSLCWDRVLHDRLRAGELPLWTRDIGGGAAFVPQMAQVYQPINLLLLLWPSAEWYGIWYLLHQTVFGWLCYRFLRRLATTHGSALLGVVVAVLGLWTQCKLHHNVILTAALPLWPMLSCVHGLVRLGAGRRVVGALALWSGLSWLSGFAVVSLQATYLTVAFAAWLTIDNPRGARLRPLLHLAAGLALGGMVSLAHMAPVLLAASNSARAPGVDPAVLAATGLEWDHALSLLWPDLLSQGGDRIYAQPDPERPFANPTRIPWSQLVLLARPEWRGASFQSWVETSFAIGLPALACALLAAADRARRSVVVFFALVAVAGFGCATADEPFLSVARLVPGLAAADLRRTLFVVAMALVVLTAVGADRVQATRRPIGAAVFLASVASLSAIALAWLCTLDADTTFVDAMAAAYAADTDHPQVVAAGGSASTLAALTRAAALPGEAANNLHALQTTAARALLVGAVGAVACLLRRPRLRLLLLLLATAGELLHAGRGPVQTVPATRVTTPPRVVTPVLAANSAADGVRPRLQRLVAPHEARVAACYPPNLPGYHGIEDAAAYNPLPPARFEQFFLAIEPDTAGPPDKVSVAYGGAGVGAFHDPASLLHPLCDLFGIRFVLTDQAPPAGAAWLDRTPDGTGRFRLYERPTVLPRATFVRGVDIEPEMNARLRLLGQRDRAVAERIVLEDRAAPIPDPNGDPTATVTITSHQDERVEIQVSCRSDGYLRLADPYDPGWIATVDGVPARIWAADHYLRAVHVPAGDHEVVFAYRAARVVWPPRLSLLAVLGAIALMSWPKRRAAAAPTTPPTD